jgi:hypothetical protein
MHMTKCLHFNQPHRHVAITLCLILFLITDKFCFAQFSKPESTAHTTNMPTVVGTRSNIFTTACSGLVAPKPRNTPWLTNITNLEKRHKFIEEVESLKKIKTASKQAYSPASNLNNTNTRLSSSSFGLATNFKGNVFNGGAPPDNSMAISTSGFIVSMVNANVAYYTSTGNLLWAGSFWELFNDPSLTEIIYDPIVLFDAQENRFVLLALHGFTSATSKVMVGFSKTDNPNDGWWIYKLSGNPLNNSCWLDYPKLGISNNEIFITGNLYNDLTGFREAVIYQIAKSNGLSGTNLDWIIWSNIAGSPITLIPASYGQKGNYGPGLFFVSQSPARGNAVDLYEITNERNKNPQLTRNTIFKSDYSPSGFAKQSGTSVELITGDCRIMNAFYLDGIIHYVFQEDYQNTGFTSINYNRLDVRTRTNASFSYGRAGFDYAFPSVASYGTSPTDRTVVICFLTSAASIFPETRAVLFDNAQSWSTSITVRNGDRFVDAFQFENAVRWGDYTGICYRYNPLGPEVWLSGCYGVAQNLFNQNYNCFNTWIGQINEVVTSTEDTERTPSLSVYPNPVVELMTVEFIVPETAIVKIEIADLSGKITNQLFNGTLKKGKNLLTFNKNAATPGVNLVLISTGDQRIAAQKIIVQE